ncbi:MAG: GAF domain-containing sensor histidine kinase, partial [Chloroflexota bacterium]
TPKELADELEEYLQGKRDVLDEANQSSTIRSYQYRLVKRLQDQIDQLTRVNEDLTLMNSVAAAITSTLDLDQLLTLITQQIKNTIDVEDCSLLLYDEARTGLIFKAIARPSEGHLIGFKLKPGQGVAGWVAEQDEPVIVNDVQNDTRFYAEVDEALGLETSSIICVPLRIKGEVIGVIEAINKVNGVFDYDTLQLLTSLASTAALAIENANLYRTLQEERDDLVHKEAEIRESIVRNLHDGPTQMLSAVSMNIDFVTHLQDTDPDKVEEGLEKLQQLANDATKEVRSLLFGLHPAILETKGIIAALQVLVDRFPDLYGTKLTLETTLYHRPPLSKQAEIEAFIIIQEAITNARKHAEASEVIIQLRSNNDALAIVVKDYGKGFDMANAAVDYDKGLSFGLSMMANRARLIDADFSIESEPDYGTTVILSVPLSTASAQLGVDDSRVSARLAPL